MSLSDDIRAMLAAKEEQDRERAEQQQLEQEEQRRSLAEFQENYLLLLNNVVVPKLNEVQAVLTDNVDIKANVLEDSGRAVLTFSPENNMYGKQFSVTFYGNESVRAVDVRTASGNTPDDPLRDEQHLSLSDATPEWLDNYLRNFIKRVLDSKMFI